MFDTKEKQILISLATSALIFVIYSLYVYNDYIVDEPEIINSLKFWGKTFLILIPIAIVAQIIIHIIFAIINKIVTNEDIPTISDERDKLIELKSMKIAYWIFTLGFMIAMTTQAFEMKPYVMFLVFASSGFIASLVEGIAQIYFYRKGF